LENTLHEGFVTSVTKLVCKSSVANNAGVVALSERRYTDALKHFTSALLYLQSGSDIYEPIYQLNTAICYYYTQHFDTAEPFFSKAIEKIQQQYDSCSSFFNPQLKLQYELRKLLKSAYKFRAHCFKFMHNDGLFASDMKHVHEYNIMDEKYLHGNKAASNDSHLQTTYDVTFHYRLVPLEFMVNVIEYLPTLDDYKAMRLVSREFNLLCKISGRLNVKQVDVNVKKIINKN